MPEAVETFLSLVSGLPDKCGFDPGCWFVSFWLLGFMVVFYACATIFVVGVPLAILSAPFCAIYENLYGKKEEEEEG